MLLSAKQERSRWKPQQKIKLISLRLGQPEKKDFEINDFLNFIVAHSFSINCRGSLYVTGFHDGHLLCATYKIATFIAWTLINKKYRARICIAVGSVGYAITNQFLNIRSLYIFIPRSFLLLSSKSLFICAPFWSHCLVS